MSVALEAGTEPFVKGKTVQRKQTKNRTEGVTTSQGVLGYYVLEGPKCHSLNNRPNSGPGWSGAESGASRSRRAEISAQPSGTPFQEVSLIQPKP